MGRSHKCIYCSPTSYIPNFYSPRRKKDLLKKVKRDLNKIPKNSLILISNSFHSYDSCNPYQSLERKFQRNWNQILSLRKF